MADRFAVYQPAADDLPANAAHGVLKRNAGNTAWDELAPGSIAPADVATAAATGTAGTMARADHAHDLPESVLRSVIAELSADPNFNSRKLTSVADPTAAQDAATKNYVDAAAAGARDPKDSCRLATAAALPANTPAGAGVGKTLTMNAIGVLTVDGSAVVLNDRVFVKNEASGQHNGIYKCTTEGTGAVAAVLTRATDADSNAEVTAGMFAWITEGTANADSGWLLTTDDAIVLDTTVLTFTQVSGLGQVTAGNGLTKTGNTIDVGAGAGIVANADNVAADWGTDANLANVTKAAESMGVLDKVARADHKHDVNTAAPAASLNGSSTNSEGVATSLARSDHAHAIDSATEAVAGLMAAGDRKKALDLANDSTRGTVQTADATVTTLASYTPADGKCVFLVAAVCARKSDGTQGAAYRLGASFRRSGAAVTQVGTTGVDIIGEDDAAWAATIDASGTLIRVRVTGVAATTIDWSCNAQITIAP